MKENVRLGRIAGIAVGFNWSLLLIAAVLALALGGNRFPVDAPGYSQAAYTLAGAFTALAFLAGVLAHEISHALVARHEGLKVDGIVLWLMGGYTRISEEPKTPGQELRISGAGPLVSLLLGVGCGVGAVIARSVGIPRLAISVLTWLAMINVLLAVFNVLPGSPLDGGRIVHAAVWWRTGDKYRATRVASRAGWFIGLGLVSVGLMTVLGGLSGVDGVWLAIVGGFLMMASRAEQGASSLLEQLEGVRAGDVMVQPGVGPGWLTVDAFLREYVNGGVGPQGWGAGSFGSHDGPVAMGAGEPFGGPGGPVAMGVSGRFGGPGGSVGMGDPSGPFGGPGGSVGMGDVPARPVAFLVEQWGGGLAGLTPTAAMEAVPPMHRFEARAYDFALPMTQLPAFAPATAAGEAVMKMNERGAAWALVVEAGRIVGVLCLADVAAGAERAKKAKATAAVDSSRWSLTRG